MRRPEILEFSEVLRVTILITLLNIISSSSNCSFDCTLVFYPHDKGVICEVVAMVSYMDIGSPSTPVWSKALVQSVKRSNIN